MTTPGVRASRSAATAATAEETERAPARRAPIEHAAAEVARRFPPMTAEQAALVRRLLRDQQR